MRHSRSRLLLAASVLVASAVRRPGGRCVGQADRQGPVPRRRHLRRRNFCDVPGLTVDGEFVVDGRFRRRPRTARPVDLLRGARAPRATTLLRSQTLSTLHEAVRRASCRRCRATSTYGAGHRADADCRRIAFLTTAERRRSTGHGSRRISPGRDRRPTIDRVPRTRLSMQADVVRRRAGRGGCVPARSVAGDRRDGDDLEVACLATPPSASTPGDGVEHA